MTTPRSVVGPATFDWYSDPVARPDAGRGHSAPCRQTFALIKAEVLAQPTGFVHRDFHSRNLDVRPADPQARFGVIDFQDAPCAAP